MYEVTELPLANFRQERKLAEIRELSSSEIDKATGGAGIALGIGLGILVWGWIVHRELSRR